MTILALVQLRDSLWLVCTAMDRLERRNLTRA
jgi:hypothetical protein